MNAVVPEWLQKPFELIGSAAVGVAEGAVAAIVFRSSVASEVAAVAAADEIDEGLID